MKKKPQPIYQNAETILDRMIEKSGKSQNRFAKEDLGIDGVNIAKARKSLQIPPRWFEVMLEKYKVTKEDLCKPLVDEKYNGGLGRINSGTDEHRETREKTPDMVRNYRELAEMDADTLGEIQTWLNDMERFRPGFSGWFRLEFQNRFPEFDDWKNLVTKKRTGSDD